MIACSQELAIEMLEKPESGEWTTIAKPNRGVITGSLRGARTMYVAMLWYRQVNLVSLQKCLLDPVMPCFTSVSNGLSLEGSVKLFSR